MRMFDDDSDLNKEIKRNIEDAENKIKKKRLIKIRRLEREKELCNGNEVIDLLVSLKFNKIQYISTLGINCKNLMISRMKNILYKKSNIYIYILLKKKSEEYHLALDIIENCNPEHMVYYRKIINTYQLIFEKIQKMGWYIPNVNQFDIKIRVQKQIKTRKIYRSIQLLFPSLNINEKKSNAQYKGKYFPIIPKGKDPNIVTSAEKEFRRMIEKFINDNMSNKLRSYKYKIIVDDLKKHRMVFGHVQSGKTKQQLLIILIYLMNGYSIIWLQMNKCSSRDQAYDRYGGFHNNGSANLSLVDDIKSFIINETSADEYPSFSGFVHNIKNSIVNVTNSKNILEQCMRDENPHVYLLMGNSSQTSKINMYLNTIKEQEFMMVIDESDDNIKKNTSQQSNQYNYLIDATRNVWHFSATLFKEMKKYGDKCYAKHFFDLVPPICYSGPTNMEAIDVESLGMINDIEIRIRSMQESDPTPFHANTALLQIIHNEDINSRLEWHNYQRVSIGQYHVGRTSRVMRRTCEWLIDQSDYNIMPFFMDCNGVTRYFPKFIREQNNVPIHGSTNKMSAEKVMSEMRDIASRFNTVGNVIIPILIGSGMFKRSITFKGNTNDARISWSILPEGNMKTANLQSLIQSLRHCGNYSEKYIPRVYASESTLNDINNYMKFITHVINVRDKLLTINGTVSDIINAPMDKTIITFVRKYMDSGLCISKFIPYRINNSYSKEDNIQRLKDAITNQIVNGGQLNNLLKLLKRNLHNIETIIFTKSHITQYVNRISNFTQWNGHSTYKILIPVPGGYKVNKEIYNLLK
jgi:hypothetical protein